MVPDNTDSSGMVWSLPLQTAVVCYGPCQYRQPWHGKVVRGPVHVQIARVRVINVKNNYLFLQKCAKITTTPYMGPTYLYRQEWHGMVPIFTESSGMI
jgi:hypothetical protein